MQTHVTLKNAIRASITAAFSLTLITITACSHLQPDTGQVAAPRKVDPGFYKWTSMDVVNTFMEEDLEVERIQPGFIIGVHKSSENTIFMIPSYGKEVGGVVSSFVSEDAMQEFVDYYSGFNKDTGQPVWRIFKKDNIVLMISGRVPAAAALEYAHTLVKMGP